MAHLYGGWTEPKEVDHIQEISDQVKPDVEKTTGKNYEEFKAVLYRSQVVAGANYLMKVKVGGSSYIHIQVYKHLPCDGGEVVLTGVEENHTKDDPLDPLPPLH